MCGSWLQRLPRGLRLRWCIYRRSLLGLRRRLRNLLAMGPLPRPVDQRLLLTKCDAELAGTPDGNPCPSPRFLVWEPRRVADSGALFLGATHCAGREFRTGTPPGCCAIGSVGSSVASGVGFAIRLCILLILQPVHYIPVHVDVDGSTREHIAETSAAPYRAASSFQTAFSLSVHELPVSVGQGFEASAVRQRSTD